MIAPRIALAGIASTMFLLCSCGNEGDASSPESAVPRVRLLVADSGDGAFRLSLDTSLLAGSPPDSVRIRVVRSPWTADTLPIEPVPGGWMVHDAPDGGWQLEGLLRVDGTVVARGSVAFARLSPLTVCGHPTTLGEWYGLIAGNLVIVAATDGAASNARDVVAGILAVMTLGSVDPQDLSGLQTGFSNGVYRYGNHPDTVETSFAFVAAQAFGDYKAGDTIRENVSNVSSYVQNVGISVRNGLTWNRGPLFGLIQGDVSFNGRTPSFSIDASRLSLTLATRAQINRRRTVYEIRGDSLVVRDTTPDSLRLRISLPAMRIGAIQSALKNGTLSFSHDSTVYASRADGVSQFFHSSQVQLYDDSTGAAQFRGGYEADARSGGLAYHHKGFISSASPQWTLFACDEALKDTLGVAHHATDLKSGRFVTASHDTIPYGLSPY